MMGRFQTAFATFVAAFGICQLASPAAAQTAVWTGGGPDTNYTTGANWSAGMPPPNNGVDTLDLSVSSYSNVGINTAANVAGIVFLGSEGYSQYNLFQVGSGSLTIGSGGISTPGSLNTYLFDGAPVILSANQTWSESVGFLDVSGDISQSGGARTLTLVGSTYFFGNNTFSGGLDVSSGFFFAGSDGAGGTGTITLADGSAMESWYNPVTLANAVTLGNGVTLGSNQSDTLAPLNLSGTVTMTNAATNLLLNAGADVYLSGTLAGPPSTALTILGTTSMEPLDGGSQMVIQGTLSNVASINVSSAQLILAPAGNPATSFSSLSASGLQVSNMAYLGLDGTFVNPGAVAAFITTYGPSLGPNMNGTLGFDTVGNPGTPNVFSDPINLNQFYSEGFLGLGSATTAILTGAITPAGSGYQFGGGGGTLTVQSNLPDFDGTTTTLTMNAAPAPVTVILQGSNTYQGGTRSSGGVLIFDSPTPMYGEISLDGGYVGYTELASNIANAQQFVSLVNTFAGNGVIGFDSTNPASPRTISDPIDLSGFDGDNVPFIGTATVVTLSGPITPANNQYQFTGVKGGQLTVTSNLTDGPGSSLTIGLLNPIESNQSSSSVTLTGNNSFSLGTTFNSGSLFINNNNALGTGPITVPDTATTTIIPYLAPLGANVTLTNPISVGSIQGGPGLVLGNVQTTDMLTLNGVISDFSGPGEISIDGQVTLGGTSTYSGGTVFNNGSPFLYVTNPSALGTGPVTVSVNAVIAPYNVDVALANDINLNSTLTLGSGENSNTLTLNGIISGSWNLVIDSNVDLNGANAYSDGTSINDSDVTVGNDSGLGTGALQLTDSTVTFTAGATAPTILDLAGDSDSTIVLAPASTLTLDTDLIVSQPSYYYGAIQGDASTQVVKIDLGTEYLGGTSTYGGGTDVSAGGLIAGASGSLGTGPITVAGGAQLGVDSGATLTNAITLSPGATLSGRGTFSPPGGVTIAGGSTVLPGNQYAGEYVSSLSFGTPVTFGTGGIYGFSVATASGVAGVDYSTVNVTGALTITSTPVSPFVISVISIDPSSGNPGMANFNSSLPYTWTLVTASSIAGFSSSDFSINTSSFQNVFGGGVFSLGEVGNTLTLNFTPVPEPSTWMLMVAGLAVAGARIRRRGKRPGG
jgi:autotransporter-associated beta strand protein